MTDEKLYELARLYGRNALYWRRKFMGLLPEVEKRKLYERKNFGSIFEFAYKLAGLSEQQVRTALNLERRFESLPALKALLVEGKVSINKLVRVASIATVENEGELAEAVQLLPKKALETWVHDGLDKPQNEGEVVPGHELGLSEEVMKKLLELQEKGLDLNSLLLEFLDKREEEIAQEKAEICATLEEAKSRPVPARTQKVLAKEHGSKCSIQTCKKPAQELHHTQTFALSKRHDPRYLAPLCREHHVIAHTINLRAREQRERAVRAPLIVLGLESLRESTCEGN
ncbi:hypothetical protein A3J23_01405 [Candidatus Peregrinibacteria bacterium RIFCSPLOWO2_02_FULL_48_14]|nr:MAG: hypothetical protein A3J23_01405 [Candidatus Peregrinibacteria bacterium RIFCSPLOWO2_02_FULL_48_14]